MDGCFNETVHDISLCRFENTSINRRYKEQKSNEIIIAICAMLNSNGGKVVLYTECNCEKVECLPSSQMSLVVRILEQSMISIIGLNWTVSNINFQENKERIVVSVKKSDSLITTNYNLYLPSQSQVVQVSPLEQLEKVKNDIINRKVVLEPVLLGSHCKIFLKDKNCDFQDSKSVQLKYLKAGQSKRTTLADRMTGKGNKFSCYVSAFANYNGGHIYYGITDDGVVEGELIPNENDKNEIRKKVEKVINKMIWPQQIGEPKRGEHWDIFFEPVVDENSDVIPSTFVIVIYIAPCLGGVFTEEPECYEMVEGKVKKMSFATWKNKLLQQAVELFHVDNIPSTVKRITWSSTRIQNVCTFADQLLAQSANNGKSILAISVNLEESFPELVEVRLVVLSKKVMVCYRSSCFETAQKLLDKYNGLLTETTEIGIFDAIRVYIETALYRAQGNVRALRCRLADALDKAEKITPGLISAAIYLLAATVMSLFQPDDQASKTKGCYSPQILSIRALEHLQYVQDSPIVRADMEQKSHITLALFYLGCNISGVLTRKEIDSKSLEKAKSSVMAVHISIDEGNPMNSYREIQFNVVRSVLFYRQSQVQSDGKKTFLQEEAFKFSKAAENLASKCNFTEMLSWARACTALCTEELVRTHFKTQPGYCTFTVPYILYLPINQQVIEVSRSIKPGSHFKEFTLGTAVSFGESKNVQVKNPFEMRSKSINLAHLLTKNSKFLCNFANYSAGHIYFGIDDDGIVQGEKITPQDQTELKKDISKAKKRWQIDFEAVKNTNGEIVPSTFVIVMYVTRCRDDVFTKKPEFYEIKENEAKIDFSTWKRNKDKCGEETNETSYEAKVDEMLTELLNDNCEWSELKKAADNAQTTHDEVDVRLICLCKLIKFCLRKGYYERADKMFEEYKTILPQSAKVMVFEIMEQYLLCLKERSKGNYETSYEIAMKCLNKLDEIQPDIVSAAFFVLIAIVVNIIAMKKKDQSERNPFVTKAKEYYYTAERHLQNVHGFEAAKADLKQKIYMNEAMLFSGSSLAGNKLADSDASVISKAEAQNCLDKSQHIVTHEMFPLSEFRDIQHNLAQSDFFYRYSNSDNPRMKKALKFAKQAEQSANDAGLLEMKLYAQNRVTLIQKETDNCS